MIPSLLLALALPAMAEGRDLNDGKGLMITYSGLVGAYQLGSLAYGLDRDPALLILLGGSVGAGTSGVLLKNQEVTLDQTMALSTSGILGAWGGLQAGRLIIAPGAERETERIAAAAQLGNLAGSGLGLLLQGQPECPPASRSAQLLLANAEGWMISTGIGQLIRGRPAADGEVRAQAGLNLGTNTLFSILGMRVLGEDSAIGLTPAEPIDLALWTAEGAWLGGWTPYLFADDAVEDRIIGSAKLGMGAGYFIALAMTQPELNTPSPTGRLAGTLGLGMGTLVGAGIPLIVTNSATPRRSWVGPMLLGGIAGQIGLVRTEPAMDLQAEDVPVTLSLGAWTLFQTGGWAAWEGLDDHTDRRTGVVTTILGTGSALAFGLPAFTQISPTQATAALSLGGWGSWLGGQTGLVLDLDTEFVPVMLTAGNALLAGGLGAGYAGWDPSWQQILVFNSMAFGGAVVGALSGVAASAENPAIELGTLIGSGVGLGGGLLVAQQVGRQTTTRQTSWIGPHLPRLSWLPVRPNLALGPWLDEDGQSGVRLQLDLVAR